MHLERVSTLTAKIRAFIAALLLAFIATFLGVSPASAGTDDYPSQWRNAPQDSVVDSWGLYNRECVSFVAWRLSSRNGFTLPRAYGFAHLWGGKASSAGYAVNMSPAVGAVAWWGSNAGMGSYGHVAWVESVNSNGTVTIEEYNVPSGSGAYGRRTIATSSVSGYIHFKDIPVSQSVVTDNSLFFIKTQNTGNGKVEVHYASSANGYSSWAGGTGTWFNASDAANGTFSMYDMNSDGKDDLVFIKTQNVASGKVELHWLNAASNYAQAPASYATWFNASDAANGIFTVGKRDGHIVLFFIKTQNTGNGKVEVHYASSANGYSSWAGGTGTWFNASDSANGKFSMYDMNTDSKDDLVFIKSQSVASGKIELHWLNAANNYSQAPASYATWFNASDAANGTFEMGTSYGATPGLVFVKTQGTTGGKVEIHMSSSANGYASWASGSGTWFNTSDASNGAFEAGRN